MNKIAFYVSCFLIPFFGFSQSKLKNGPFVSYYKSGEKKSEGNYRDGNKVGAWVHYHENGKLSQELLYDSKGRDTYIKKAYYESGELSMESAKLKDNNHLITKGYFRTGKLEYSYNSVKSSKGNYYLIEGPYKKFNEEGVLVLEAEHKANSVNGLWKTFYNSGILRYEVNYKEGMQVGVYKSYYQNGNLKSQGKYIRGKINGTEKQYAESGKLLYEGSYKDGLLDGIWVLYDDNRSEIEEYKFEKGVLKNKNSKINIVPTVIPYWVFEECAIYPGCEGLKGRDLRDCFAEKMNDLIRKKFNTNITTGLGLHGIQRIYVTFKINKNGQAVDIKAKAKHPRLKEEAIRVIEKMPKVIPGRIGSDFTTMSFVQPIVFRIR